MSEAVDTRIVEAKFNSKDFEKGVDKTIKALEDLKKNLQLEKEEQSVAHFSKSISESTEKTGNSLEKLTERLTTFTGQIKQQLLSGLANEVSAVFFKIESSVKRLVTTLSTQQVSSGMSKYTEILNSVRTMTAALGSDSMDASYEQIKRLSKYSDQTSYSLSQMTSGMSKFVAAGAGLEDAEKMIEGLANMAASAGVNIYDANRAFVNFAQAFSSGSMKIQDWQSFEALNMSTEQIMKLFMQAGEASGALVKTVKKDGTEIYKTSNKVNKKIQNGKEVALTGFRDTLRYGWIDKETMKYMTATLSYFEDLDQDMSKLSDEELKEFAAKAYQAAKEARSFSDVLGTLKDVIATGWSQSFEYIFGKLDKATEFFTWLTESNLAQALYNIGEIRNIILGEWSKGGENSGPAQLIEALHVIDDLIGDILQKISPRNYNGDFAESYENSLINLGERLRAYTIRFREFVEKIRLWLNTAVDPNGETRLDRIIKILGIFGTAISAVSKVIGVAWHVISKIFVVITPTLDALTGAFASFAETLNTKLQNTTFFTELERHADQMIDNTAPLLDFIPGIIQVLGELVNFILDIGSDVAVEGLHIINEFFDIIGDFFGSKAAQETEKGVTIFDRISDGIRNFKDTCHKAIKTISEFFDALFADIRQLLGISKEDDALKAGGAFSHLASFFQNNEFIQSVKVWFNQTLEKVGAWIKNFPMKIKTFFENIVDKLFYKETTVTITKKGLTYVKKIKTETALKKWLDTIIEKIKAFIADIPTHIKDAINFAGGIIRTIVRSIFGVDDSAKVQKEVTDAVTAPFKNLTIRGILDNLKDIGKTLLNNILSIFTGNTDFAINISQFGNWVADTVSSALQWISSEIDKAWNGWDDKDLTHHKGLKEFIIGLPGMISDLITGERTEKDIDKKAGPIEQALINLGNTIGGFILDLPSTILSFINEAIPRISEFWDQLYKTMTGQTDKKIEVDDVGNIINDTAPEFTDQTTSKWDKFVTDLGETVSTLFSNIPTMITSGLDMAVLAINSAVEELGNWFKNNNIAKTILKDTNNLGDEIVEQAAENTTKGADDTNKTTLLQALGNLAGSIWKLISETIPTTLVSAWEYVRDNAGKWWEAANGIFDRLDLTDLEEKVKSTGETIASFIRNIPSYIRAATDFIRKTFEKPQNKQLIDPKMLHVKESLKEVETEMDSWTIFDTVKEIGKAIGEAFKEIGPYILDGINWALEQINKGFDWVTDFLNKRDKSKPLGESLTEAITGDDGAQSSPLGDAIRNLGETIKNLITKTIPDFIVAAFDEIKIQIPKLIGGLFNFLGGNQQSELTEQIEESDVGKEAMEGAKTMYASIGGFYQDMQQNEIPAQEAEGAKRTVTDFGGILSTFNGIIDAFTNNDSGRMMGTLAMIALIIYMLHKVLDDIFFLDDLGYNAKWEGIKIAIVGIIGLIGYLIYLSETGNEAQIQNVEKVFDKVINVLKELSALLIVVKSLQAMKAFFDWRGAKAGGGDGTLGAGVSGLLKGALVMLGGSSIVGMTGDIVTESISSWSVNIAETFENIGVGMDDLVRSVEDLAVINDKIEAAKKAIGQINELFAEIRNIFTIELPTTFEEGKNEIQYERRTVGGDRGYVWYDKDGVEQWAASISDIPKDALQQQQKTLRSVIDDYKEILSLFDRFSASMSLFKQSITTQADQNAVDVVESLASLINMTDKMTEFANYAKQPEYEAFKKALDSLGASLQIFSLSDIEGLHKPLKDGAIDNAVKLLTEVFGNQQLKELISRLSSEEIGDTGDIMANAESIAIFAGALSRIAKACVLLTNQTSGDISKLFETVSTIDLGTGVTESSVKTISERFGMLGNAIGSFATNTLLLSETNIENAKEAITMILDLAIGLKDLPSEGIVSKLFIGDRSITSFGIGIENLGQNLQNFFDHINSITHTAHGLDYERKTLEMVLMTINSIANDYMILSADTPTFTKTIPEVVGNLSGMGTQVMTFLNEINNYKGMFDNTSFVFFRNVFGSIADLVQAVETKDTMRTLENIKVKFEQLGKALIGEGNNKGFVYYVKTMVEDIGKAIQTNNLDFTGSSLIFDSFTEMVSKMVDAIYSTNAVETVGDKPFANMIDACRDINNNISVFTDFLGNTAKFDTVGIDNAKTFFEALHNLASTLYVFGQQGSLSQVDVYEGLHRLLGFDWASLTSVKDGMLSVLGTENLYAIGFDSGMNLDKGLADGISSGQAVAAAQILANAISGSFTISWDMHSPSKLFETFGQMLDAGLAEGINSNKDKPIDAASDMAQSSVDNITSILDLIKEIELKDEYSPVITPVVDMTNIEYAKQQMDQIFGAYGGFDVSGMSTSVSDASYDRMNYQKTDYTGNLYSIGQAVNYLRTDLANMSNNLSKMKIVMDTGTLVGVVAPGVDQYLGREGFYASRV